VFNFNTWRDGIGFCLQLASQPEKWCVVECSSCGPSLINFRHKTDKSDNRSYRAPTDKTGNAKTDNTTRLQLPAALLIAGSYGISPEGDKSDNTSYQVPADIADN